MKKHLKFIFILILIIIFLYGFSASYSTLNIDNIAVVVAIGIDAGEDDNLLLSFQFTNPSSISEDGTSEEATTMLYTVSASSFSSGLNILDASIGRQLNLSHCKIIAFSEDVAKSGISSEIYTLINNTQIRPSTNIAITKCTAKEYLENSEPSFENLITEYYEVSANSSKYTGYTADATIGDFFNNLLDDSSNPYAILGDFSESSVENIGLAVFKDDTFVR